MELLPLFLFTLLGGLGAGTYVAETFLQKERNESKPWLVPLIAVVVFVVGTVAATFHVSNIERIFTAQVNFGAGMVMEIAVAGCFLVLVLADLIVTATKKGSPYALRVVTAVVGLVSIITMGVAYVDVYGVEVWTNAPATILVFLGGDLAMGVALLALVSSASYADPKVKGYHIATEAVLALGLLLQIVSFAAAGLNTALLVAGLVLAPVAGIALAFPAAKGEGKGLSALICVCVLVGVALMRWAFYAACMLF